MSSPIRFSARAAVLARVMAPALVLTLSLTACDSTRRALGYDKAPPDEFQVVQRAPLSMPPDFNLRPPMPGLIRPQEGSTTDQAKSALLGASRTSSGPMVSRDSGDVALLKRASTDLAQPGIRDLVNKETLSQAEADKSFTDKLVFWSEPAKPGDKEQLDAMKEAQRLQTKQGIKAPAPTIQKSEGGGLGSSLLGGSLFGGNSSAVGGAMGGFFDWMFEK